VPAAAEEDVDAGADAVTVTVLVGCGLPDVPHAAVARPAPARTVATSGFSTGGSLRVNGISLIGVASNPGTNSYFEGKSEQSEQISSVSYRVAVS
jgi:hypothetical protein